MAQLVIYVQHPTHSNHYLRDPTLVTIVLPHILTLAR